METVLSGLEILIRETKKSEAEVMALVFRSGVRQLRRELTLGRYLRGIISRAEAVEAVGLDWVEMAERQKDAMLEDIAWATSQ